MKNLINCGAAALFLGASCFGFAMADEVSTAGGIKVKTEDGKFDFSIGGRLHFDSLLNIPSSTPFGSTAAGNTSDAKSDFEFRRAFLTIGGHLYGFEYKFEDDFASNSFQDVYIAHPLFGGTLYAGQRKPWRSLDEIASNNNVPFLERNYTSSSNGGSGGIYGGNDYTEGLYYSRGQTTGLLNGDSLWVGASVYSLHKQASSAQSRTQGTGYNARVAYAPITGKTEWAHIGVSYSNDNLDSGTTNAGLTPNFLYAGRIGPTLTLANYTSAAAGTAGNPHADIVHGELAGVYGPLYAQAEYVDARYHQRGQISNQVDAYSVTAAYTLTGESRSYDSKNATYGAIRPVSPVGAFELAVRYDHARNGDTINSFKGASTSYTGVSLANATELSVSTITVGLNYYVNPAVRFVLDYSHGRAATGPTQDVANAIGLRTQLVF